MNRSFRGPETLMPSIKPRAKSLQSSMTMRERDEDLALFLEMRKREKEKNDLLFLQDSHELDETLVSQPGSSPLFNIPSTAPTRKPGADDFLNSENEKNDYDWLLTPPGTPLFPLLDMESRKSYMNDAGASKPQPTVLRSRLANSQTETTVKSSLVPKPPIASAGLSSSVSGMRRPSSSGGSGSRPLTPGGPGSRPATPTSRPTLTSSKSSRPSTPTSRGTLPSAKSTAHSSSPKPTASTRSTTSTASTRSTAPSRSSTPSKTTATSSTASTKSTAPSRSSTPSRIAARPSAPSNGPSRSSTPSRSTARSSTPTRSTARSSTPTARPSVPASRSTVPASRPTSRASTPTRRPSTQSSVPGATATLNKSALAPAKNPVPSRGASPTIRSRPWNPSEMPGFSLDAPPNLRTTLLDRPLSATRGRPAAPSSRSGSIEPVSNGRQRRQSCSPSRGCTPNGSIHSSGSSVPAVRRGHSKVGDDISPIVIGTKMVDRVINMRKLGPPRQDDKHSPSLSGKSASSPDSSGFGRTLSKKSLDMAIRHMDIRRSLPGNLRPLMTKIPASSMYSIRSGATGSRTTSVCDSPLATSSNASSELSVNYHSRAVDGHCSEMEDDLISERGCQASPTIVRGLVGR